MRFLVDIVDILADLTETFSEELRHFHRWLIRRLEPNRCCPKCSYIAERDEDFQPCDGYDR